MRIVYVEQIDGLVFAHIVAAIAFDVQHGACLLRLAVEFEHLVGGVELELAAARFRYEIDAKFALPCYFDVELAVGELNTIGAAHATEIITTGSSAIALAKYRAKFVVRMPLIVKQYAFVVGEIAHKLVAREVLDQHIVKASLVLPVENVGITGVFTHN